MLLISFSITATLLKWLTRSSVLTTYPTRLPILIPFDFASSGLLLSSHTWPLLFPNQFCCLRTLQCCFICVESPSFIVCMAYSLVFFRSEFLDWISDSHPMCSFSCYSSCHHPTFLYLLVYLLIMGLSFQKISRNTGILSDSLEQYLAYTRCSINIFSKARILPCSSLRVIYWLGMCWTNDCSKEASDRNRWIHTSS